jgi:hypothetical protein
MNARARTAALMAFRDQLRRPLVPILLVVIPAFIVFWSVAITKPTPRRIELPGDLWVTTTMKALHGPEMAKFTVAFVAALVGVFVMQASLQGDRRLIVAGYRIRELIAARVAVLLAATMIVVGIAALVTARGFEARSWTVVVAALLLAGLIYAAIGALAGALLDKLAATYLILFLLVADLSVVQTPMFHAQPARFAWLLPGYGPTRLMLEGAYAPSFHAGGELMLALAWLAGLVLAVLIVVRRKLGVRAHRSISTEATDRLRGIFTAANDPWIVRRERSTR